MNRRRSANGDRDDSGEDATPAFPNPPDTGPRRLACARCGAEFGCNPGGPCWCSEETFRLPLPKPGQTSATGFEDCLCRDCLRALAGTSR